MRHAITAAALALLFALPLASCSSGGARSTAALAVPAKTPASLNELRRANGRAPISRDRGLDRLAAEHSANMARAGRMSHSAGQRFSRRMRAAGLGRAAENIARGQRNVPAVMAAWARSPGHRRNMLDAGMTRYGLASVRGRDGRLYWTMILAK